MKTVNLTTKKEKKSQSPLKWVVMIVLIFLLIFAFNTVFASDEPPDLTYDANTDFRAQSNETWQWLFYLPINHIIPVAIVDSGMTQTYWQWIGYDFEDEDDDASEENMGHGSKMASVIFETYIDDLSSQGINPDGTTIINAKIDSMEMSQAKDGCTFAIENHARIINMSFAGYVDGDLDTYLENMLQENDDVFVLTAGGNEVKNFWFEFTSDIWSIAGLNLDETAIYVTDEGRSYQVDENNTNIKFGAVGEGVFGSMQGGSSGGNGSSYSSALFSGAISRLLSYDNTYTRESLYNLLTQFSVAIDGAGAGKIDWQSLVKSLGITRQTKRIQVTDSVGNNVLVTVYLIYHNDIYQKTILNSIEYEDTIYYLNKDV